MLLSASWVIRARWREIQRFVSEFKTIKRIHDMECWFFLFIFQNRRYGLKHTAEESLRMSIVEIILLNKVSATHFL